jgi:2-polyprenyl-6-methoxyphenol hydroxylase-like FAD-dependent oxidoreductase
MDGVELYPREGRAIVAEQTNDGLVYVASAWRHAEYGAVRADIEGQLMENVRVCAPGLYQRMRMGTRVAPFRGTDYFDFYSRKPYGPGWALVGDAGYHRDAVTGQGITDAFRDADLLSAAIDAGLGGAEPLSLALANYERCRNEAVMPMYEFTYDLARLAPPTPSQQQLFGALRGNQLEINRFLGLMAGTVSLPGYFAEENIGRIIGEAQELAA